MATSPRDETEEERLDRNTGELLQELRVAQTGVQILFAFLLTLPFTQRFPELKSTEQFKELLPAIDRAESDLQNWRVRCNATIKDNNSHRSALPHALYASMLGFRPARYLELESV